MSKWDKWWDSLPEHTKIYLRGQPLWYDKDLAIAAGIGFVVGLVFGLMF
jgi:hypothetical protein